MKTEKKIFEFLNFLDDSICNILKELVMNENLLIQLKHISSYLFIVESVTKLEANDLTFKEQIGIYLNVKNLLKDEYAITRFEQIYSKNPDIDFLRVLNERENDNLTKVFMFINLTTVSVERSFSFLKSLLSEKRLSMDPKKYFIIWHQKQMIFK